MSPVLKIFGDAKNRSTLAQDHRVLAGYDAFTVVEATDSQAQRLARRFIVEDITHQYDVMVQPAASAARGRTATRSRGRGRAAAPKSKRPGPGRHHYIVQFVGPIKRSWLAGVKRKGGEVRRPFAGFSVIVRADAKTLKAIEQLPYVRWTGHLPHAARIADSTRRRAAEGDTSRSVSPLPRTKIRPGVYTVQFFGPDDLKKGAGRIKKLGFRILDRPSDSRILIVESTKPPGVRAAQLERLSTVHGVRQVRERSLKRTTNDVAAGLMGASNLTASGVRLSGRGEIIAVCDTGLDTGESATIHPDFLGRIVSLRSFPITPDYASAINNPGANDGAADRATGHGTHVAGSVLGDGRRSVGLPGLVGRIRGLSHKAKLVFQAVEQELDWKNPLDEQRFGRFVLAAIPADLTVLLRDAHTLGARIHSNSWNGGDPGAYDVQCEQLDRFVWNHKDMCVLVAAGNDGTDEDADGVINPMSVTSPSTAKNCITVGASENRRTSFNDQTYGEWWPQDYPVGPFNTDAMANNPRQVVAFSSRGPTADGRFKPDVLAPGTFILSTRSRRIAPNNHAWGAYPPSTSYFHMGGTSMATPLVAGAAGLFREHFRKKHVSNPSAALVKAAIVASAGRLPAPGPRKIVDNNQGYGLVNLLSVLKPSAGRKLVFDEVTPGLQTGEAWRRTIRLTAGSSLRIVLAYSDFPGETLVNDLNLIVFDPAGRPRVGNQTTQGMVSLDATNNVEVVDVSSARAGDWRIEVIGSNVPEGPQDFAVVILGRVS